MIDAVVGFREEAIVFVDLASIVLFAYFLLLLNMVEFSEGSFDFIFD